MDSILRFKGDSVRVNVVTVTMMAMVVVVTVPVRVAIVGPITEIDRASFCDEHRLQPLSVTALDEMGLSPSHAHDAEYCACY